MKSAVIFGTGNFTIYDSIANADRFYAWLPLPSCLQYLEKHTTFNLLGTCQIKQAALACFM